MLGFWHRRRVAVTGATGLLGSHLVAELCERGAEVVVLRRDLVPPTSVAARWAPGVTWVDGDVTDQALLERLFGEHEITAAFHLAAQTQVEVANLNPVSTFDANIAGTWSLLEAARRSPRLGPVVVASSDKAYGEQAELPYTEDTPLGAVHPYDVSKACADLLARSYAASFGLNVGVTRCGNLFGPGDLNWRRLVPGTIRSVLNGERPVIRSDGTLTRDYVYVVDAARFYLRLAEALAGEPGLAGEAWNFAADRPLSVLELVRMILAAAGSELQPDVQDTARNEIPHQYLSSAKARTRLGWAPEHSTEEALARTIEWYRTELGG